jgi:hypothetical protein
LSVIRTTLLAKARPLEFHQRGIKNYFDLLERILIQIQGQIGLSNVSDDDDTDIATFGLAAQLAAIVKRLEAIESEVIVTPTQRTEDEPLHEVVDLSAILKRLDAIEAQL